MSSPPDSGKKLQNGNDQRVLRAVAAVIVVSGIMDISAKDGKSFCSALALIMLVSFGASAVAMWRRLSENLKILPAGSYRRVHPWL